MEDIIAPVSKDLILSELTPERLMRKTRKAGNELYVVDYYNAPHTLREIGRLREIAFRQAGGGSGLSCDLDVYDTMEDPYQQLIVWNPDAQEIIGGYRYLLGDRVAYRETQGRRLATSHLFDFSDEFIDCYLPNTLELGRSFVSVEYQSAQAGIKALFALDNLWDGLGALTIDYPYIHYYFGKVTMYQSFPLEGRDKILYFLQKHFPDPDKLVTPITPLVLQTNPAELETLFCMDNFKENYRILNQEIRALSTNIPPLINTYMNLSPTMRVFGTAINDEFGDVEETGILVKVKDIVDEKRIRHIESYVQNPLYALHLQKK